MNLLQERTLALAGTIQAVHQVQNLAYYGKSDEQPFTASIQSILVLDAVNTRAVYGGIDGVRSGLELIRDNALVSAQPEGVELIRYVVSLMNLRDCLSRNHQAFTSFASAVERLSSESEDSLVGACAAVYTAHLSEFTPKIIVRGEENHLTQADIAAKIRALLLAGVRSTVLWQQKGGSKFKLMWERTRMRNAANYFLNL